MARAGTRRGMIGSVGEVVALVFFQKPQRQPLTPPFATNHAPS